MTAILFLTNPHYKVKGDMKTDSNCPNCNAGWFDGNKCFDCGTKFYHGVHLYKGDEFPDSIGERIHVWDDHSNPDAPCYRIQFVGSTEMLDNMDDCDVDFILSHTQD